MKYIFELVMTFSRSLICACSLGLRLRWTPWRTCGSHASEHHSTEHHGFHVSCPITAGEREASRQGRIGTPPPPWRPRPCPPEALALAGATTNLAARSRLMDWLGESPFLFAMCHPFRHSPACQLDGQVLNLLTRLMRRHAAGRGSPRLALETHTRGR